MYDLGLTDSIEAETIGEPGQRTFKITARGLRGEVVVWMEKEQLFQVGVSLKQFLATRESTADPVPFTPAHPESDSPIAVEFKTGDMSLRHDAASDVFTLSAEESQASEDETMSRDPEQVEFSFTRAQAESLAETSLQIVAAGRPPCPLCSAPLDKDSEHFCVKVNGHNPAAQVPDE